MTSADKQSYPPPLQPISADYNLLPDASENKSLPMAHFSNNSNIQSNQDSQSLALQALRKRLSKHKIQQTSEAQNTNEYEINSNHTSIDEKSSSEQKSYTITVDEEAQIARNGLPPIPPQHSQKTTAKIKREFPLPPTTTKYYSKFYPTSTSTIMRNQQRLPMSIPSQNYNWSAKLAYAATLSTVKYKIYNTKN